MDLEYQDQIIETQIRECDAGDEYHVGINIDIMYGGTPEGPPARKLLVDYFCWNGGSEWVDPTSDNVGQTASSEFTNDLLLSLMCQKGNGFKGPAPWIEDPPAYFVGSRKKTTS